MVLVEARGGGLTADSAEFRQAVQDVKSAVEATGQVQHVRTPYDPADPAPRTSDGTAALVLFDMTGAEKTAGDRVQPVLDAVSGVQNRHPELRVEQAGAASLQRLAGVALAADFKRAEALSLPITAIILLLAFGTLLPTLIPLTTSKTAFFAATGLLALASKLLHVADTTTNLMLLIGLAVGVDYSLFYLSREREERAKGRSKERALQVAAATSGRAVLISGCTVILAMAGMFFTGNGVFMGFAQGTILIVLTAMVASVTVLPALLSLFGDAVDARLIHGIVRVASRGRVTWSRRLGVRSGGGRAWNAVLGKVLRHPWISTVLAGGGLVALAVPALGMRVGQPGVEDLQGDYPIAGTYTAIDRAFPGGNEPAIVAAKAPDVSAPGVQGAIAQLKDRALGSSVAHEPVSVQTNPDRTVATISLSVSDGEAGRKAVETLRDTLLPETVGAQPGTEAYVTGSVAGTMDFNHQLARQRSPGVRVRAPAGVPAAGGQLPVGCGGRAIHPAQPAVGRGGVRHPGPGLPERPAGRRGRGHRELAAPAAVRDPVRPVDGLSGFHPQPHPRSLRSRPLDRGGHRVRHQVDGERGDQRCLHHGGGVRGLRHDVAGQLSADGRRSRGGHPDRRHAGPGRAGPRHHEAPRRPDLVPAPLARLVAHAVARRGDDRAGSGEGPPSPVPVA